MTQNKPDLRVRRTQKMLRDAFVNLVIAKGFGAINVQMLADEAMINRATFYRHYADKYDLAEKTYASLAADYAVSIQDVLFESPEDATRMLFEHVAEYADFYQSMLATMPRFQSWVRKNIEDEFREMFLKMGLNKAELGVPLDLALRYMVNAQIGLVEWWLETGMQVPIAEMAQHLNQLHLLGGIQALKL
ncbi:MAG: TetR/AcrR family transcriptional regulator C-terminal domain-containing protein [Anaerolineae bacterium]